MQTQRVNRTDAEKIFLVAKNVDADSITTGWGARFVGGAAAEIVSTDGVSVVKMAASGMSQLAGIAVQDIASNGFGLFQAYGYVNSIAYSAVGTSITVGVTGTATSFLRPGAVAGSWFSGQVPESISTAASKYVQAWTSVTISTAAAAYGSGFVRAI